LAALLAAGMLLATAGSALADVQYVDLNSTKATPPYTNWVTTRIPPQGYPEVGVRQEGHYHTGAHE